MSNDTFEYGQTGFQSAGNEFAQERTSLEKYLNLDQPQTFTMTAGGNSKFLSIKKGDKLIICKGHDIKNGYKVVAYIQNNLIVGQVFFLNKKVILKPYNIEIGTEDNPDDHIWGVITHIISDELKCQP